MRKIKYQGGITKLIASAIGKKNKDKFTIYISSPERLQALFSRVNCKKSVNMDVVSFSSSHDFSEQVLSILSYSKCIGLPVSWTVYSDGSHTTEQINLLQTGIGFVKFANMDLSDDNDISNKIKHTLRPWQDELLHYSGSHPFGKRLLYNLNHPIKRPTLFIDSDILFYEKANVLSDQLDKQANGYFLPDVEWGNLDSRFLKKNSPQLYQANGGLYIVNKEIPFLDDALNYLKSLNGKYEYFSEQTIIHVLLTTNYFVPLDPRIFILDASDQFDFSYLYPKSRMALRHYTGPVRHKMWQKDWKWQLSIS